jgi:hypothetical protein
MGLRAGFSGRLLGCPLPTVSLEPLAYGWFTRGEKCGLSLDVLSGAA